MAILKLYNDEKVIELLNDDADMENPLDSWSFDGNNGLSTDRTLFLLITENRKTFWRSIHIRYNMMNDKFYIDNISHEEYFEIDGCGSASAALLGNGTECSGEGCR